MLQHQKQCEPQFIVLASYLFLPLWLYSGQVHGAKDREFCNYQMRTNPLWAALMKAVSLIQLCSSCLILPLCLYWLLLTWWSALRIMILRMLELSKSEWNGFRGRKGKKNTCIGWLKYSFISLKYPTCQDILNLFMCLIIILIGSKKCKRRIS